MDLTLKTIYGKMYQAGTHMPEVRTTQKQRSEQAIVQSNHKRRGGSN